MSQAEPWGLLIPSISTLYGEPKSTPPFITWLAPDGELAVSLKFESHNGFSCVLWASKPSVPVQYAHDLKVPPQFDTSEAQFKSL